MAATGYTTGDPQKVDVAGDTMTGELVLPDSSPDTALAAASRGYVDNTAQAVTAASETRYVNVTGDTMTGRLQMTAGNTDVDVQQALSTAIGTGVIYGGEINATPAVTGKFDVSATAGYIVDYLTDETDPAVTMVTIPAQTVALDSAALTRTVTWILADSAGNIIQQAMRPTNTQRRTHLQLGVVAQASGTIFVDQSLHVILENPLNQLYDLMYSLGPFNIDGNILAAAGTNLQLQKSAGNVFVPSSNHFDGPVRTNDPHVSAIAAQNPVSIRYVTSVPAVPVAQVTSVAPGSYDVGGVVTAVPGGANTSTIQRVFLIPANLTVDQIIIQYGSVTYASLDAAVAALSTEQFTLNPNLADAILLGYVVVTKTATNLASTAQARLFGASKFGGAPSGGSALGVLTAYALLSGAAFTGPVSITNAALSILAATKGYRMRTDGGSLDFEATGADLILSNWSGTAFNGTQRSYDRYSADADNVQHAGKREWVDALYGATRHVIEDNTGIAAWGSKNGLTNIRLAGFKNSAGAPTTGDWLAGDVVLDSAGAWHLCTASGTPGSWT